MDVMGQFKCAVLVLLVVVHLALFSLLLDSPGCSASWTVWTRRDSTHRALVVDPGSGICRAGFSSYCTSRCVPSCCRHGQDACHHGPNGPEGTLRGDVGVGVLRIADFPQLHHINKVVDFPADRQWPIFMVQPVWMTTEFPQFAPRPRVDVHVLLVVRVPQVPSVEKTFVLHHFITLKNFAQWSKSQHHDSM